MHELAATKLVATPLAARKSRTSFRLVVALDLDVRIRTPGLTHAMSLTKLRRTSARRCAGPERGDRTQCNERRPRPRPSGGALKCGFHHGVGLDDLCRRARMRLAQIQRARPPDATFARAPALSKASDSASHAFNSRHHFRASASAPANSGSLFVVRAVAVGGQDFLGFFPGHDSCLFFRNGASPS